jgi:hypothetical protein
VRDILERGGARVIGAVTVAAKKSPAYKRKRGYGSDYGYDVAPSDFSVE